MRQTPRSPNRCSGNGTSTLFSGLRSSFAAARHRIPGGAKMCTCVVVTERKCVSAKSTRTGSNTQLHFDVEKKLDKFCWRAAHGSSDSDSLRLSALLRPGASATPCGDTGEKKARKTRKATEPLGTDIRELRARLTAHQISHTFINGQQPTNGMCPGTRGSIRSPFAFHLYDMMRYAISIRAATAIWRNMLFNLSAARDCAHNELTKHSREHTTAGQDS